MGKVMSAYLKKPFRNFNVESRAHKVISRDKPIAAPRYEADQKELDRLMQEAPEKYEQFLKKNESLDKRLKDVFVVSHDPDIKPIERKENPDKPLPVDRSSVEDYEFGFKESENIPEGKITLKNALKFITNHQADPRLYNVKKITEEFKLPEETVRNVLKYFKVFEVYVPRERDVKAKFAGPSIPRVKVIKEIRKEIGPGENKDGT